jgi:hypothetical protein
LTYDREEIILSGNALFRLKYEDDGVIVTEIKTQVDNLTVMELPTHRSILGYLVDNGYTKHSDVADWTNWTHNGEKVFVIVFKNKNDEKNEKIKSQINGYGHGTVTVNGAANGQLKSKVKLNENELTNVSELKTFLIDESLRLTNLRHEYLKFYTEDDHSLALIGQANQCVIISYICELIENKQSKLVKGVKN